MKKFKLTTEQQANLYIGIALVGGVLLVASIMNFVTPFINYIVWGIE